MVLYGTRTVPDALPELDVDSKVDRLVLERLPLEQVEACAGFVRHVHLRNRNRADSARCSVPRHVVVAQHAMLQHYCVRACVRVCVRTNARVYRREYHSIVLMLQLRDDVCEQQPRVLAPETRRFQRQPHRYLLRLHRSHRYIGFRRSSNFSCSRIFGCSLRYDCRGSITSVCASCKRV